VALEVVSSKPKEAPACSGTVMLVDDEQVLVDLGQEFLRRAGFKAVGFSDALAALEWYKNHWGEVDLIILDMKMPGIDGEQAFGRLRDINPAAQIAMLSGYSQDGAAQELLSRGALRFFQKPLKYPDLVKWIAQTLSKSDAA
jgi:two-component system cell cycle sensor histidine kinase/response regulator CckA